MTTLDEITRLEAEIERVIDEASAAAYADGRLDHPAARLLSCAAARPLQARLRDLRAAAVPVQVEAPAPAPTADHRATEIRPLAATNPARQVPLTPATPPPARRVPLTPASAARPTTSQAPPVSLAESLRAVGAVMGATDDEVAQAIAASTTPAAFAIALGSTTAVDRAVQRILASSDPRPSAPAKAGTDPNSVDAVAARIAAAGSESTPAASKSTADPNSVDAVAARIAAA